MCSLASIWQELKTTIFIKTCFRVILHLNSCKLYWRENWLFCRSVLLLRQWCKMWSLMSWRRDTWMSWLHLFKPLKLMLCVAIRLTEKLKPNSTQQIKLIAIFATCWGQRSVKTDRYRWLHCIQKLLNIIHLEERSIWKAPANGVYLWCNHHQAYVHPVNL